MRIKMLLAMLLTIGAVSCTSTRQITSSEKEAGVALAINDRDFKIAVYEADPIAMRARQLSGGYYLRLSGYMVDCHLPYFGAVYTPYGNPGERLTFRSEVSDYITTVGRRGVTNIYFNVTTVDDRYRFEIEVYPGGSSTITVRPMNKQQITFYGNIELPK